MPARDADIRPSFAPALAGEQTGREDSCVSTGGMVYYWDLVITPIVEDGKVVGILHTATDVTERKQAESRVDATLEALWQSEERFAMAMQGANDGLWDWDVRTDRVYYSPRWKAMLGYDEDEIEPWFRAWERLVHPDDKPAGMEGVRAFLSGEVEKFEIEFRMRHKAGHYVDVLSRAFGVREDPGGPVVRIVGTHVDITERKRAEEAARRQSEYLSALHETALGVISRLDVAELLETLVERAVDLVDASFGFAYELVPGDEEIEVKIGTGWFHKYVGNRLRRGQALSGKVWASGQPLAVDNFEVWSGYIHPEGEVGPALGVPLRSGTEVVGVLGIARTPADPPFGQDEIDLIGRFGNLASIALDNARLHTSLEQRVQDRTRQLATLNAVAAGVSRSLDLEEILSDALDQTMAALDMECGVAYRLEGKADDPVGQRTLHPLAQRGFSEPFLRLCSPIAIHGTKLEAAAASGEPLIWTSDDVTPDPEIVKGLVTEGVRQVASIPLMAKGKWVGAIYAGSHQERTFTPEQISLMAAVGQQVGLAVENARLYEQAEQAAALAERNRLARGLHDSVTQSLYSVTMYAEAAARLLDSGQGTTAAEYLREARDTAQEALREMRLLIFELRPLVLEESGLAGALQTRLDAVEKRAAVQVEYRVEGVEEMADADWLPLSVQQELYHIAQEALNNSLKHAKAEHLRVCLRLEEDVVFLEVADDGGGFDPAATTGRGGLGLPGMRERVQRLGGRLAINSAPGSGTKVSVEVPRGERPK
jgi:PAS domain S-box-containing protein